MQISRDWSTYYKGTLFLERERIRAYRLSLKIPGGMQTSATRWKTPKYACGPKLKAAGEKRSVGFVLRARKDDEILFLHTVVW